MLKGTLKSLTLAAMLATGAITASAADYTIRAQRIRMKMMKIMTDLLSSKITSRAHQMVQLKLNCSLARNSARKVQNVYRA